MQFRRAWGGGVQIRYKTDLSAEAYVITQGWRDAILASCPRHPGGGCSFARHGSYGRKTPAGIRVARFYCRDSHTTFGLLPDFLAARMPGTLCEIEAAAAAAATSESLAAAARRMRPGRHIDPGGARRRVRFRVECVRRFLTIVIGLFPDRFAGLPPEVGPFRMRLATETVLTDLRGQCAGHLHALHSPVGFRPLERRAGSQTGPPTADDP